MSPISPFPVPTRPVVEEAAKRFGAVPAFGEEADPEGFLALHCAKATTADLASWLLDRGARRVSVVALEQAFDAKNPLFMRRWRGGSGLCRRCRRARLRKGPRRGRSWRARGWGLKQVSPECPECPMTNKGE